MQPLISIIIPVYKVEKYIRRCIDSVIAQTYHDWELILVDDGSPDRSGVICDEYAAKDSRISVYHKENGGVSSARNLGLDKAKGEWVTFVDSDDTILPDCLNICVETIKRNNLDMLQYSFELVNPEGKPVGERTVRSGVLSFDEYVSNGSVAFSACSTFFKRESIIRNKLYFSENLKYAEDLQFTLRYMSFCNRIMSIDKLLYKYYMNPQSATHGKSKKEDIVRTINAMISLKSDLPLCGKLLDTQIANFLYRLIKSDENKRNVIRIINEAKVNWRFLSDNHCRLMMILFNINKSLSYYLMRIIP